ncbi:MAG: cell wall-active antibiotics response protein [bacterium]|nr:cell wall-active antibiotics response protein [bacterium]
MEDRRRKLFDFPVLIGLFIVAGGVMLLLQNLGVKMEFKVWDFWPVLIILLGVDKLVKPAYARNPFLGSALIGIGVLFLLDNLDYLHFKVADVWPVAIILVGGFIIKNSIFRPKPASGSCMGSGGHHRQDRIFSGGKSVLNSDFVDSSVIFGGGEYQVNSKQFKGGNLSVIMGGIEIDLRDADIVGDEAVIQASVIMGGIEARVPSDWEVVLQGSPIMGSFENKSVSPAGSQKRLVITGSVIMGGVEVTN